MNVKTMSAREHGVGDSRLMGPVSGLLWITAGIAAAVVQPLPGTPQGHAVLAWSLIALIMVYGVACVRGWIDWERRTLRDHAVAIIVFQPLIALGLWVSGGVDSYLGPILVLPTLYVAYFFPPRFAWPLAVIEIATYCSPFLYSDTDHDHLLLGRAVMYAAAYAGLVATIQYLKSHLVAAERKQRRMAHEDPLTGCRTGARSTEPWTPPSPEGDPSRCCWSTSTTSRRSTTRSATRPATRSCAGSPRARAHASARRTRWRASAATSSLSWRPTPRPPAPNGSPPRCMARSRGCCRPRARRR
jgi:hypothetical protein